jgi:type IV pilus assembly protein PilA
MKNLQKGFTLIELMIVVAIIAILAAIAIPAYQNYLVRSQVSEAAVLADGVKTPLTEYYANKGSWPSSTASIGLPSTAASLGGKYVSGIVISSGIVSVTLGNKASAKISGEIFALSPTDNGGSIAWTCNGNTGAVKTTVPQQYLPATCRTGG